MRENRRFYYYVTNAFQLGVFSHGTGMFWQAAVSLVVITEQHELDIVFFTSLHSWKR